MSINPTVKKKQRHVEDKGTDAVPDKYTIHLERVPRKKRQPLNWFGMPMTRLTCCLTHVQDVPYV